MQQMLTWFIEVVPQGFILTGFLLECGQVVDILANVMHHC